MSGESVMLAKIDEEIAAINQIATDAIAGINAETSPLSSIAGNTLLTAQYLAPDGIVPTWLDFIFRAAKGVYDVSPSPEEKNEGHNKESKNYLFDIKGILDKMVVWTAIAGIATFLKSIGVLHAGTDYVPQNMLAYLEKGERVTSAKDNAAGNGSNKVEVVVLPMYYKDVDQGTIDRYVSEDIIPSLKKQSRVSKVVYDSGIESRRKSI
jgi:hypothetical protein